MRLAYTARNFERAVAFYRDTLGMSVVSQWDRADGRGAILDTGAGGGGTALVEVFGAPSGTAYDGAGPVGTVLMLEVPDVDALYQRLVDAGMQPGTLEDRPWGRVFRVNDPEGLAIDVYRRVPAP